MKRTAILIFGLLLAGALHAQQYGRMDFSLQNAQGQAISGAQVNVYTQSACGAAAGAAATLYPTATGGTPLAQPLITNGFGHQFAYALQGCYTVAYNSPYTGTLTFADQVVFVGSGTGAYVSTVTAAPQTMAGPLSSPEFEISSGGVLRTTPNTSGPWGNVPLGPDLPLQSNGPADVVLWANPYVITSSTSVSPGLATIIVSSTANLFTNNPTASSAPTGLWIEQKGNANFEQLIAGTNAQCAGFTPTVGLWCIESSTQIVGNFVNSHSGTYQVSQAGANWFRAEALGQQTQDGTPLWIAQQNITSGPPYSVGFYTGHGLEFIDISTADLISMLMDTLTVRGAVYAHYINSTGEYVTTPHNTPGVQILNSSNSNAITAQLLSSSGDGGELLLYDLSGATIVDVNAATGVATLPAIANSHGIYLPSTLTGPHGSSGTKVQLSDGTGTSTHPAIYGSDGSLTDGPAGYTGSCAATTTLTVVDGIITGCS